MIAVLIPVDHVAPRHINVKKYTYNMYSLSIFLFNELNILFCIARNREKTFEVLVNNSTVLSFSFSLSHPLFISLFLRQRASSRRENPSKIISFRVARASTPLSPSTTSLSVSLLRVALAPASLPILPPACRPCRIARKASRKRRQTAETRWAQSRGALKHAKSCKLRSFEHPTLSLPPCYPVLSLLPRTDACSSTSSDPKARVFLTSSRPRFLFVSPSRDHSLLPVSPLFLAFSPFLLRLSSSPRSSALHSFVPQHPSPPRSLLPFIPQLPCRSRARESERQKCFDDCVPRRLVPLFLPRGWNTRLGGAAAAATATGAHRGMKPRPPYLRLSVD